MTVKEAREARVCRICGRPISLHGGPANAPFVFGEMTFPEQITFNYGEEFAHTDCLKERNELPRTPPDRS
jgi:hypothetical protein